MTGESSGSATMTWIIGLPAAEAFDNQVRSAGSYGRDNDVDLTPGVFPDLFGGGLGVDGGVVRVRELLGNEGVRRIGGDFFSLGDGAFHALGTFGENELRAEQGEERASFKAHGLRHREDELVAFGGANESQCNTGVTAGGLDDNGFVSDLAGGLSGLDHGHADSVFHGAERIKEFALESDGGIDTFGDFVELDDRSAADCFDDVVVDLSVSHEVIAVRSEARSGRGSFLRTRWYSEFRGACNPIFHPETRQKIADNHLRICFCPLAITETPRGVSEKKNTNTAEPCQI